MSKKNISKFYIKALCFLIPIYLLAGIYIYNDPFKVLKKYKIFSNIPMDLNQNYIGWQTFLNHKDSIGYDSFILGNSCTMAFPTHLWEKYIGAGKAVRLYGSAESISAINKKLIRLDQLGCSINNALILLDFSTLEKIRIQSTHTKIAHPDVTGESPWAFQLKFVSAFFNPKVLIPFLDYSVNDVYRPYMKGVINTKETQRDQLTNDIVNPREVEISQKKEMYWQEHGNEFPQRRINETYPPIVNAKQIKYLSEMKEILNKHHTNFKIVINPEWSQVKLNPNDITNLNTIFGEGNVFDFSGKNDFTDDCHNYYEGAHYRPTLGKKLLDVMYSQQ